MKSILTLLSIAALASVVLAGGISGQVLDKVTGDPIAGAVVIARGEHGGNRAVTNRNGAYRIPLRPGEYRVSARARGYEPKALLRPVVVRENEVTEGVDVVLKRMERSRPGAISGRVTDARTGDPIAGAVVIARGDHGGNRAVTNRNGVYRMPLRPGEYRVSARARGYEPRELPRPVVVRRGEVIEGVDFELKRIERSRPGAISGRVTDARTGDPIAGAAVIARGDHGGNRAVTNRNGVYRMPLRPGEYRVSARARGYEPRELPRPVVVRRGEVTEDVDFALRRSSRQAVQ